MSQQTTSSFHFKTNTFLFNIIFGYIIGLFFGFFLAFPLGLLLDIKGESQGFVMIIAFPLGLALGGMSGIIFSLRSLCRKFKRPFNMRHIKYLAFLIVSAKLVAIPATLIISLLTGIDDIFTPFILLFLFLPFFFIMTFGKKFLETNRDSS